jgi:hypothetical protein
MAGARDVDGLDDLDPDAPGDLLEASDLGGVGRTGSAGRGRPERGRDPLAHEAPFFSYEPGTTRGAKKHTSSSGSGPSDSVAWKVPGATQTVTPASISAVSSGVTMRPLPAAQ